MSRTLARTLVFVTSAAVLVVEILAARLLAPYLGVSLDVFTGIIGVILAGISIGAWLGGRAADRTDPARLLGPLLVVGGLSAMASPLIVDTVGPSLSTDAISIVVGAALGFFIPAAVLSAVAPVVVKIRLGSLDDTGKVVGSYSAIGTAGAIVGTFGTGFVLIAAFPTRPIVAAVGSVLAVGGVILWATRSRWSLLSLGAVAVLVATLLGVEGPCQYETTYHCAVVSVDGDRPSGRTLVLDRVRNSYVDLEDATYLEFRYIKLMADIIETELSQQAIDAVYIGGGGFTLPGYLEATRPQSTNTVLEIDRKLVEIGETDLGLGEEVEVVVDDARISLKDLPSDYAELVVGDAYSGASVPWHLTTVEFHREIGRVLSRDGIYMMNVIDYGNLDYIRAQARTLTEVFPEVALFAPLPYLSGDAGGNYVLVAAYRQLDVETIERAIGMRGGVEIGIEGEDLATFIGQAKLLTDDYGPVDQLLG